MVAMSTDGAVNKLRRRLIIICFDGDVSAYGGVMGASVYWQKEEMLFNDSSLYWAWESVYLQYSL